MYKYKKTVIIYMLFERRDKENLLVIVEHVKGNMKYFKMLLIPVITTTLSVSCINNKNTTKYNYDNKKYYVELDKTNLTKEDFLTNETLYIKDFDLTIFNFNIRKLFNFDDVNFKLWEKNLNIIKNKLKELTNENSFKQISNYYLQIYLSKINDLLLEVNKNTNIDVNNLKEIEFLTKQEFLTKFTKLSKNETEIKNNITLYFYLNAVKVLYAQLWNIKITFSFLAVIEEMIKVKHLFLIETDIKDEQNLLKNLIAKTNLEKETKEFNDYLTEILTKNIFTDFEENEKNNEIFITLIIDTSLSNSNYDFWNSLIWVNKMYTKDNIFSLFNFYNNETLTKITYFNNILERHEKIKEILINNDFDFNTKTNFYKQIILILTNKGE